MLFFTSSQRQELKRKTRKEVKDLEERIMNL